MARDGRQEVRVAAAGVEHRNVGGALDRPAASGLDQFILQFERAECCQLVLFGFAFAFCHDAFSIARVRYAGGGRSCGSAGVKE
jgi:hypothetical protein